MVASSADSPQPQATGTAQIKATNGATTNTHSITRAAVDFCASIIAFGAGAGERASSVAAMDTSALKT
jgi:hypothetical protein